MWRLPSAALAPVALLAMMLALALSSACTQILGDDFTITESDDDGTTGSGGSGGTEFACVTVFDAICSVGNPQTCSCNGCINDNVCSDANGSDDCVCPDCHAESSCANACVDDGLCEPFREGCSCTDCAAHPACGG
jgi:hypothetical protein